MAANSLHMLDMGLLRKWDYEANGPLSASIPSRQKKSQSRVKVNGNGKGNGLKKTRHGTFADRLAFGLNQTFNFRKVGTPYEVKNVPLTPPKLANLTRRQWLVRNSLIALAAAVFMDLQSLAPPPPPETLTYCSPKSLDVLSRIYYRDWPTLDEVAFRIPVAISSCFFATIVLTGLGKIPAIVFVLLGISDHTDWRPYFGPFSSTYSLRGFWGDFWHQMLRDPAYQPVSFLLHDLLHIPRSKGWLLGSVKVGLVFMLSALMHLSSELGTGSTLSDSGSFSFFQSQVIGILIEDAFKRLLFCDPKPNDLPDFKSVPLWQRAIGHLWVFTWLTITSARYVCVILTYNDMKPLLGFSLAPKVVALLRKS